MTGPELLPAIIEESVGALIYTYNRTDDARINMELIRSRWSTHETLRHVVLVHAYNGERSWWPRRYLEDSLIRMNNVGHYDGAAMLIDAGIQSFAKTYPQVRFLIVLAADTWCMDPSYVAGVIQAMKEGGQVLATCPWGDSREQTLFEVGAATDFFIIDLYWARRFCMVPLRYHDFKNSFGELLVYLNANLGLERLMALRFLQAIARMTATPSDGTLHMTAETYLHRLIDREPIHIVSSGRWERRMSSPEIGLICEHDPVKKRLISEKWSAPEGKHSKKFWSSGDFSYYNRGII